MDASVEAKLAKSAPKATGKILCADDDEPTRHLLKRILATVGLDVATAADGAEAWEMLQSGSFDLLITDYQMPGLTGLELIRMVRQASMSVPIILTSGMLGTLSLDEQPLLDCRAVLAKPFTPEQLITLVQDVLPAKPGLKHTQPTPGKMD